MNGEKLHTIAQSNTLIFPFEKFMGGGNFAI